MAFRLPKFGSNTGTFVGGVVLGAGLTLGAMLLKGGARYADQYIGGGIPDEFLTSQQYGGYDSGVTYYFPEDNFRILLA